MQTFTLPMRLAIEEATSIDAAEMELVTKKMVPSSPSGKLNLRWKKYVIQELFRLAMSHLQPFQRVDLQRRQTRCKRVEAEQNEQPNHQRPQILLDRWEQGFLLLYSLLLHGRSISQQWLRFTILLPTCPLLLSRLDFVG